MAETEARQKKQQSLVKRHKDLERVKVAILQTLPQEPPNLQTNMYDFDTVCWGYVDNDRLHRTTL